ncbi:MAG: hypothetical protein ABSG80_10870 [Verrucomicrobiota bacterium]|jgi:membrane protein YdbS with pleckstrin-like domain
MLLPAIPFWIAAAFVFLFHNEKFDQSTFWSSSFFAVMGLIIALAVIRIHFRFREKVELSRLEKLIVSVGVFCAVCWLTFLMLFPNGLSR